LRPVCWSIPVPVLSQKEVRTHHREATGFEDPDPMLFRRARPFLSGLTPPLNSLWLYFFSSPLPRPQPELRFCRAYTFFWRVSSLPLKGIGFPQCLPYTGFPPEISLVSPFAGSADRRVPCRWYFFVVGHFLKYLPPPSKMRKVTTENARMPLLTPSFEFPIIFSLSLVLSPPPPQSFPEEVLS